MGGRTPLARRGGKTPYYPLQLSISGNVVTTGTSGSAYAGFTVTAAGGVPPYVYSIAAGLLPPPVTLNATTGVVSTDVLTTIGTYSGIVIRATDSVGTTADLAAFTITVSSGATAAWRSLKIGGGGFVTRIDVHADGTKVIRTDTYGAYLWNDANSVWRQLVTIDSMPTGSVGIGVDPNGGSTGNEGVFEIAIAPTNSSIFYMMFQSLIYKSIDKGTTWTKTNYNFGDYWDPNVNNKVRSPHLAIDPQNSDVVFAGPASAQILRTIDGGATWTTVTGVPSSGGESIQIAFDPSSSVVSGKTQGIYAASYGNGLYHSTDGGSNWTLITGSSTQPWQLKCSSAGVAWMTYQSGSDFRLGKVVGGVWSGFIGSLTRAFAPEIVGSNVYVAKDSGELNWSADGGATWSVSSSPNTRVATDIPWLANTNESYMSAGYIAWDATTSRLYFAEGIGVWYTTTPRTTGAVSYVSQTAGIENLTANRIFCPALGKPVATAWDRPAFYSADPEVYPSHHGVNDNADAAIVHGHCVDFSQSDHTKAVGLFNYGIEQSGYSIDGGQNWTKFSSNPPFIGGGNSKIGGAIATKDGTTIVWVPDGHADATLDWGIPYVSTNRGTSWSAISISGVPTTGQTGWGYGWGSNRQTLTIDANLDFYIYNNGRGAPEDVDDFSFAGVYKSSDGITWTKTTGTGLTNNRFDAFDAGKGGAQLRAVPGQPGHLFYSSGHYFLAKPFWRTINGGSSWTAVPNVQDVWAHGFGKVVNTYPTIYIAGYVSGVFGVWMSIDNAVSWTRVGNTAHPLGSVDSITWVEGDKDIAGQVYIAFHGSSWGYYRP